MYKSLAIAVSFCLVALTACDVEAGIFGRRSGCRGGTCYRTPTPRYTYQHTTAAPAATTTVETARPTQATNWTSSSYVQPSNGGIQSPSDLPVEQVAPAPQAAAQPVPAGGAACVGGNCYVPTYRSSCAGGNCSTRGWRRYR